MDIQIFSLQNKHRLDSLDDLLKLKQDLVFKITSHDNIDVEIDELEKKKRKLYAGSIGYFTPNNEFDTCIALRTALIKDQKFYVQAGAGIVADSKPINEYKETINKAKALINALK